jgi:hypothetical protein
VGVAPPPPQNPPQFDEIGTIFEQRGVLTPRHSVVVEPSLQYSHSSSNRIVLVGYTIIPAITVGLIDTRAIESNTVVAALSLRYGITGRFEGEVKIPYVYRTDSATTQTVNSPVPDGVFNAEGHGLGDVEFGVRYQFTRPGDPGAILIGGLRAKSRTGRDPFHVPVSGQGEGAGGTGLPTELPTGSGFWGLQGGITAVVPSDPAVFFGSVSYLWNFRRSIRTMGTIDPGDVIGVNFGFGVSLNERTSFSIGYDHSVVETTTLDGKRLGNSMTTQVGSLGLGVAYKWSEKTNLNVSLSAGLTEAAPDVQFMVRFPTDL